MSEEKKDKTARDIIEEVCNDKKEGWYSEDYNFTHLTVHAWCDLEPYKE